MSEQTALTVVQRAVVALGLKDGEKELIELAGSFKSITAITNPDGYTQCHAARMTLKNRRVEIENAGKEARADATAFNKAVIAEERRLVGLIEPEESRLGKLEKGWDDAREAERQAKIEAELKRVADLQERVAELRGNQNLTASSGSKLIAEHLADLEAIPVDESFEEMQQQAADAKGAGLKRLADLHSAALAHEAEQERLKAEREELARLRAEEQKRQAAERARIAEEERQAKAARDAEAAQQAEILRRERAENEAREAEARKVREAEEARLRQKREEFERTQREAREAEERRLAAERAEREREDRERRQRQEAEEARLAAERAEFERQQEEARKAAAPIAPLTRQGHPVAVPSMEEVIHVLAAHYKAHPDTVAEWLMAMDFRKCLVA